MNLKPQQEAIQRYWNSRSERERKLLLAWAVGVSILLVIFGVIVPLQQKTAALQKRIPVLEKQLLLMRAQNQTVAARPAGNAADLRSTMFEILARKQISADIRSLSNGRIELRLPAMQIREALTLAQSLRDEPQTKISALQITTDPDQSVRMVLEAGKN